MHLILSFLYIVLLFIGLNRTQKFTETDVINKLGDVRYEEDIVVIRKEVRKSPFINK